MNRSVVSERLLGAGRELFARRGYDGTSVRALTGRARANLGAITYHFGSKQAFYHQVIESLAEPLAARVGAAAEGAGGPLERIEGIVRSFLDYMAEHPEMPQLIVRELASQRALPPPAAKVMRRNLGAIAQVVATGQADGSIRGGDPSLLALSVAAQPFYFAIAGRAIQEALGIDPRDAPSRRRIADHLVTTIHASLASHPKVLT